jgi:pyruvate formate lyase activating enzyme
MQEALLYSKEEEGAVRCGLCAHRCLIKEGKRGICGVRENQKGSLYSLVYGQLIAAHIDPIEKKPLFHFYPGSRSYSIATVGCNFRCTFCQNADISQMPHDQKKILGRYTPAQTVVREAKEAGCTTISYTYTEPTVFFEYALETARLAVKEGIKNVFVTNGFMTREALELIHPDLHAANVDLKAFREETYKKTCGAKLTPVLETLKTMRQLGIWVEVTTLVVPTLNDSPEELTDIARFIARELGPEVPWHISRFHPDYRLTGLSPTPVQTLRHAWEIGKSEGLRYVYTGNVPGDQGEKTFCARCGTLLLDRVGFSIRNNHLKGGRCPQCQTLLDGKGLNDE